MNRPVNPGKPRLVSGAPADTQRPRLGELLRDRGLIHEDHIQYALQEQKITRERIGEVLIRCGFVSQYDVATVVAGQEGLEYLDVSRVVPEEEALRLFSLDLCVIHDFLPLRVAGSEVHVVTANTDLDQLHQVVARHSGLEPVIALGETTRIKAAIQHFYYFLDNPVEELLRREITDLSIDDDQLHTLDSLLTNMFRLAVKYRATDIHIRPMPQSVNVAFRIDGILRPMFSLVRSLTRIISTIKIRANMDIAEQRLPQDGGFSARILDNDYDVRVSTTVSPSGENVVLRILPRSIGPLLFEQLGFLEEDVARLQEMFSHPHGMILLTGPTGSGKTTTLFAGVRGQDLLGKNVLTVENPIEYKLPLIRQTEVNEKAGYTFASAIRHFLRHDPDIILVGEIRDGETAQTAITAAETGHLVLSTLHTNDAFGSIPRLHSLGVTSPMLADSLVGVVSQRLLRRICDNCKESYHPDQAELQFLRGHAVDTLWRGQGCDTCLGTGYFGRTPVYEILRINKELTAAIAQGDRVEVLRDLAAQTGFEDMFANAVKKISTGITSVSEVRRVLGAG
ncbi:MAG: Flp pilus assembly complex ATPase component TadA [Gammaproteobacteria bacterium]|nr:Flp pilus assembly complex ATPase component TadA [Gammaproteobacteria bacterium]